MSTGSGGGDGWMTPEEVCKMIRCNKNQLYKLNQELQFPVYKRGKHCLYLYSEVNNWMMNQDTRIKDDPKMHRKIPVEDLPKVWPPEAWPFEAQEPKPPRPSPRRGKKIDAKQEEEEEEEDDEEEPPQQRSA